MQSKKINRLNFFSRILEKKNSIYFISVNNLTIEDKISLQIELNKIGLELTVLKNGLFRKTISTKFPQYVNLESIIQGFCFIVYPKLDSNNLEFNSLREFAVLLEKKKSLLFLGGIHENKLVNKTLLEDVISIKNPLDVYKDLISVISSPQYSVNNSLKRISNNLVTILNTQK